jgi:BTB/POZ domain
MIDPRATDFYDVKFLVGPEKHVITGNKIALACASTVFHRMFFSDFPNQNEIIIPDIEEEAFKAMINSISGRDVILTLANVGQVYYAAEKYDLPFLRRVCKTFVVNSTNSTNALTILNTFQNYNESDINEKCLSIILDDPLTFFKKPEFLKAPAEVVRTILKPTYINCSTHDLTTALKDWMAKNGLGNYQGDKWIHVVENQLKITREDLEMKMPRQNLFNQFNYSMPLKQINTVVLQQSSSNTFNLDHTQFFLQGFGLVMGKVRIENFTVHISNEKGLDHSLGKFMVEKKGPIDVVSIQDVFFQKTPIFHDKLKITLRFVSNNYRPYVQYKDKDTCVTHLILSKMQHQQD